VPISWKFRAKVRRTAKSVLALVLVAQMFALVVLVASPALHHALHPDSNHTDHGCLVTLFLKGQLCEAELTPVVTFMVVFLICAALRPRTEPHPLFQYCFAPSRAPPVR
jgi:hypothetical protein